MIVITNLLLLSCISVTMYSIHYYTKLLLIINFVTIGYFSDNVLLSLLYKIASDNYFCHNIVQF